MEQAFDYIFSLLVMFSEKYAFLSFTLMVIGGVYIFLTSIRAFLTGLVKITKTDKDDKIVLIVYAFLDKFAYGFGKFADYYEDKSKK